MIKEQNFLHFELVLGEKKGKKRRELFFPKQVCLKVGASYWRFLCRRNNEKFPEHLFFFIYQTNPFGFLLDSYSFKNLGIIVENYNFINSFLKNFDIELLNSFKFFIVGSLSLSKNDIDISLGQFCKYYNRIFSLNNFMFNKFLYYSWHNISFQIFSIISIFFIKNFLYILKIFFKYKLRLFFYHGQFSKRIS